MRREPDGLAALRLIGLACVSRRRRRTSRIVIERPQLPACRIRSVRGADDSADPAEQLQPAAQPDPRRQPLPDACRTRWRWRSRTT